MNPYLTQLHFIIALLMFADAGMVVVAAMLTESIGYALGRPLARFPRRSAWG